MYHLNGVGQRKSGLTSNKGGPSLLSTFRNPSTSSESEATIQASGRTKGSARDDVIVSSAPSVAASLRSARICHRATIPMAGRSNGADDSDDDFVDIDSFAAPAQITVEPGSLPSEDGDIIPTVWKSAKEHDEETQRLLRESNLARINPQHVRGAGFNIDSVRQAPGPGWDKGPGKRKVKATYKGKSVVRSRPDPRAKKTTPLDAGDEGQLGVSNNTSVAWAQKGFKDPLKHYALPALKGAEPRPFRDPMLHSLPPKTAHSQGGNDFTNTSLLKSQQKGFQDPTEKYKLRMQEELTLEFEKSKPKGFLNPFTKNYNLSPREEKSQSQTYYIDDLKDEIASVNHDGGSKKRKASRVVAIDLSTPKTSYGESEELSSSPNDGEGSLGGSQSSTIESQFPTSSQVRHMDDISLELRETKLREQEKKRKKRLATADICVLCDAVLPLGALDAWKSDDGELRSIRMAEWTEICNKHKAEDLRKEWKEKEYPVIEWKGLKKRVEKHHQYLVDIVENKVKSPFREAFAKQQKEIRGNTSLLLRKDHQLQYPGYYGPRGSGILLHEITVRLASTVGDAGKRDGLIAQGGVAAFIQTVLVPELGVRLIMEDMNVREAKARIILDESRNIGEKLNMDEFTEDIYDEDDGPWFDINAKTPEVAKKRGLLDGWNDFHEDY